MNTTPANLSAILGFVFIGIAILGLIGFLVAINRKNIDPAKLDKVIDIWKWTLGVFIIGVSTSIISDSFKQREADKNDMAAFGQYANIAIDTGTVDKKWRLCEFFIAVAPAGRLRDAWTRYEQTLIKGIDQIASLNQQEKKITSQIAAQVKPTTTQIASLNNIQDQKQQILTDLNAIETGTYLIIAGGDKDLDAANDQLKKARAISTNAILYKRGGMYRTVLTGFSSKQTAQNMIARVQAGVNSGAYIVKQSNWCTSTETTPNCLICNF
jgi:hypothetical protein